MPRPPPPRPLRATRGAGGGRGSPRYALRSLVPCSRSWPRSGHPSAPSTSRTLPLPHPARPRLPRGARTCLPRWRAPWLPRRALEATRTAHEAGRGPRLRAPCGRGGRGGRGTLRGGEARRGYGQAHRGPLTAWRRAPPRARARPLRQPALTATTHPPFFVALGTSGGAEGGHLSLRACPAPPCQTQSPRLSGLPGADLGDLRDVPLGSPPV